MELGLKFLESGWRVRNECWHGISGIGLASAQWKYGVGTNRLVLTVTHCTDAIPVCIIHFLYPYTTSPIPQHTYIELDFRPASCRYCIWWSRENAIRNTNKQCIDKVSSSVGDTSHLDVCEVSAPTLTDLKFAWEALDHFAYKIYVKECIRNVYIHAWCDDCGDEMNRNMFRQRDTRVVHVATFEKD